MDALRKSMRIYETIDCVYLLLVDRYHNILLLEQVDLRGPLANTSVSLLLTVILSVAIRMFDLGDIAYSLMLNFL